MKLYSPKNHKWYDRMIKKGFAERDENYYSVFANGNPSEVFLKRLISNSGKQRKVLDIGCGYGKYTQMLSKKFYTVTGIDLSQQSINFARSQHNEPNIAYIVADSRKLPFKDKSFDVVFSRISLHSLSEMFRVLKPKGFALCMRIGEYDALDLRDLFEQEEIVSKMKGYIDRCEHHSKHKVDEWREAGFVKVKSQEYEYDMHFETIVELAKYLSRIPIIPEFDMEKVKHMKLLKEYAAGHKGDKSKEVVLHRHRYIVEGFKP